MERLVGVWVGGGEEEQKLELEETRVGVTRHREHVVVALAVEDGSHVHAESTRPSALVAGLLRLLSNNKATNEKPCQC